VATIRRRWRLATSRLPTSPTTTSPATTPLVSVSHQPDMGGGYNDPVTFWLSISDDDTVKIVRYSGDLERAPSSCRVCQTASGAGASSGGSRGRTGANTTADDNREDLRALAAGDGIVPGLVALEGGGRWVGARPRRGSVARAITDAAPVAGRRRLGDQLLRRRQGVATERVASAPSRPPSPTPRARGRHAGGLPVQTGGSRISSASVYRHGGDVRAGRVLGLRAVHVKAASGTPRVVMRRSA
jgi:hypothetical protein